MDNKPLIRPYFWVGYFRGGCWLTTHEIWGMKFKLEWNLGSVNPEKKIQKTWQTWPKGRSFGGILGLFFSAGLLKHEHKTNRAAQGTLVVSMFFLSCLFPILRGFYLVDSYFYKWTAIGGMVWNIFGHFHPQTFGKKGSHLTIFWRWVVQPTRKIVPWKRGALKALQIEIPSILKEPPYFLSRLSTVHMKQKVCICPSAPRPFWECILGRFLGSKYLLKRYLEHLGCIQKTRRFFGRLKTNQPSTPWTLILIPAVFAWEISRLVLLAVLVVCVFILQIKPRIPVTWRATGVRKSLKTPQKGKVYLDVTGS